MLVPGLMVFLPVVHGSRPVCVSSEVVELRSSLMGIFWHILVLRSSARVVAALAFFEAAYYARLYIDRFSVWLGPGELLDLV